MKFSKDKHSRYFNRRNALILLVVGSLLSLFLTPISEIKHDLAKNLPWVGIGTIITEGLFIFGLGVMAWEAKHELGKNPLAWRKKIHSVINKIVSTKTFWYGFWINALGAVGTAVVVGVGIVMSLPFQSWGLLWLPIADLGVTIAIRTTAIAAIERAQ